MGNKHVGFSHTWLMNNSHTVLPASSHEQQKTFANVGSATYFKFPDRDEGSANKSQDSADS